MDLIQDNTPICLSGQAIDRLAKMLDDPTQCYKFYWLDAIMNLFQSTEEDLLFDDIFNEMICAAWNSVTEFHLSLGPTVNGASVNLLERAIHIIENGLENSQLIDKQSILKVIKRNETELIDCKKGLAKNVPYIKYYILHNINKVSGITQDTREYILNKCSCDPNYVVRDYCREIIQEMALSDCI